MDILFLIIVSLVLMMIVPEEVGVPVIIVTWVFWLIPEESDEPKEPTPVIQQETPIPLRNMTQEDLDKLVVDTEKKCIDINGIWLYNECITD